MEILIAVPVVILSVAALSIGLMLRGRPLQTSCSGMSCLGGVGCEGCPKRRKQQESEAHD